MSEVHNRIETGSATEATDLGTLRQTPSVSNRGIDLSLLLSPDVAEDPEHVPAQDLE